MSGSIKVYSKNALNGVGITVNTLYSIFICNPNNGIEQIHLFYYLIKPIIMTFKNSFTTHLKITRIDPAKALAEFLVMPANSPSGYQNLLPCWPGPHVGWGIPPYSRNPVTAPYTGNQTIKVGPDIFTIGYAVGPELSQGQKYGNVCATSLIAGIGEPPLATFASEVKVVSYTYETLNIQYNLPAGNTPRDNGAWIGIWIGEVASYYEPPIATGPIMTNMSSGTVGLNKNIRLGIGLTYTVGLFMSGWGFETGPNDQRPLACSRTFKVVFN